jgi:hypothetical protein
VMVGIDGADADPGAGRKAHGRPFSATRVSIAPSHRS